MDSRAPGLDFGRVKLVVWDLDDTLWDGTLAEGDALRFVTACEDAIVALVRAGIMCSVASHNDFAAAKAVLEQRRLWEWLIFPRIEFSPKSGLVGSILESARLRPHNTVVVDDKARIRSEIRAAFPDLLAAVPREDLLAALAEWLRVAAPRADHRRLAEYKVLESKAAAQRESFTRGSRDPEEFLRQSSIRCVLHGVGPATLGRIEELVNRTNQLNFTKQRATPDDLVRLFRDPAYRCGGVSVSDRFGDYGLCGFFALDTHRNRLRHFVFSCRILQMGVEAALYQRLGRPPIEHSLDMSDAVHALQARAGAVNWVQIVDRSHAEWQEIPAVEHAASADDGPASRNTVRFVGHCDLLILGKALARVFTRTDVLNHVLCVDERGHRISAHGHESVLRLAMDDELVARHGDAFRSLPWLHPALLDRAIFSADADVVVLSAVRNVQQARYLHESGEFAVPFDQVRVYGVDTSDIQGHLRFYHGVEDPESLRAGVEFFHRHFRFDGFVSGEQYEDVLIRYAARLAPRQRLIVLNLREVPQHVLDGHSATAAAFARRIAPRHQEINGAIDRAALRDPRISILDVNATISSIDDLICESVAETSLTDSLYHFSRRTYMALALQLAERLEQFGMVAAADVASFREETRTAVHRTAAGIVRRRSGSVGEAVRPT